MARRAPSGGALGPRPAHAREDGVSPIIGTMFVFVIIVMGMAGALIFGVPSIQSLQERSAMDDVSTQLEQVREEAEKLTVEGAGSSVVIAPAGGSVSLVNGTRMAVSISYNASSEQQGLALAWGKGGKKKAAAPETKRCDFHLQDWEDGDRYAKLVANDCYTPMRWDPADGVAGVTQTHTYAATSAVASSGWTGSGNLATTDGNYAVYATGNPQDETNDLRVAVADPTTTPDAISSVVVKAVASATGGNDGYKLQVCLSGICETSNSREASGTQAAPIAYVVTSQRPGGGSWSWTDIPNIQAGVRLAKTGQFDDAGGWRVDRIWVEVTSGPAATNGNNNGKCFATSGVACLQAFPVTDTSGANYVQSVTAVSGQSDTYNVTLTTGLDVGADWYFQLSKDPRDSTADKLLAKAYIIDTHQLLWERDGMLTWLEGGAVFGSRSDVRYLLVNPLVDEEITDNGDPATCADPAYATTPDCRPTFYLRIIRFQGDQGGVTGSRAEVALVHNATHSTTNDGVAAIRMDFHGHAADLWCDAFLRRGEPAGYSYSEHEFDGTASDGRCDGHPTRETQGIKYAPATPVCPDVAPQGYSWPSGLSEQQRATNTGCVKYVRDQTLYFKVIFTEVLFDVRIRP